MRRAIGSFLLSVFLVAPWASAQTVGATVRPGAPRGGEPKTSLAKVGHARHVVKRPTHRRLAHKKPAAIRTAKRGHGHRAPARHGPAVAKAQA